MSSLELLSLAEDVVQFVHLALETTTTTDAPMDSDAIYDKFHHLQSRLEDATRSKLIVPRQLEDEFFAVKALAGDCKMDCDRLMSMLRPLTHSDEDSGYSSSRHPSKRRRREREAMGFKQRLERRQEVVSLQICKFMRHWHGDQKHQLRLLQLETKRLRCSQSGRVTRISKLLKGVDSLIRAARDEESPRPITASDIVSFRQQATLATKLRREIRRDISIVRTLSFDNLPTRHNAIPDAHRQTFEWTFSPTPPGAAASSNSPPSTLLPWLEQGSGVFWVSGKPGSGKSTFMKFISDDTRTGDALSKWSHPKAATVISHYFWCAGTPMQRSQQGLVQALVFEILRQFPDAIEVVCPSRWHGGDDGFAGAWSMDELYQTLLAVVRWDDFPAKLCFFIDGLDEYDGNHLELCNELKALASSDNVKLCLSSRPWTVFSEAFGAVNSPSLCLHELTRLDIGKFVQDRLNMNPSWANLLQPDQSSWLINEITARSEGVFLWVSLVTKLLSEEMSPTTTFDGLRDRLEKLPTDLDDFFTHSLESVDKSQHSKMATSLLVALAADRPLDISIYYFHYLGHQDADYVLGLASSPPSRLETKRQRTSAAATLSAICRGLLEPNERSGSVSFLHRTVRDYLARREILTMLSEKAPAGFSADECLLKAFAAWIKTSSASMAEEPRAEFLSSLDALGTYAARLDGSGPAHDETCRRLIDDLDMCLTQKGPAAEESLQLLRHEIIGKNLASYLSSSTIPLQQPSLQQPTYLSSLATPALVICLFPTYQIGDSRPSPSPWNPRTTKTLHSLFRLGADPNERFSATEALAARHEKTPWTLLCEQAIPHREDAHRGHLRRTQDLFRRALGCGVFQAFLDRGADPGAECERPGMEASTPAGDYIFNAFRLVEDLATHATYLAGLAAFLHGQQLVEGDAERWFSSLRRVARREDGTARDVVSLGFMAEVVERLLPSMTLSPDARSHVWDIIENAFPPALVETIRQNQNQT